MGFDLLHHHCHDPDALPDFDVMLEAKAKDLALVRPLDQLARRGIELEPAGAGVGTPG